jgi:hypothetical protein
MLDVNEVRNGSTHRLNISLTMSISTSAAAIFSADVGCGLPPNKNDIMNVNGWVCDCELIVERDDVVGKSMLKVWLVVDMVKARSLSDFGLHRFANEKCFLP